MNTLLLTGTIQPNQDILFLNVKDPNVRYKQYSENIVRYISFSDFDSIVFCENSGFEIKDLNGLMGITQIFGKELEILQFMGDHNKAVRKGRGYGESEIIEYAVQHSRLIKQSGNFIKITGRYRCDNINQIISGSKDRENCFSKLMPVSLSQLDTKAVNTAVYKTSVGFFNKVLDGAGEDVDDAKNHFLEHVYFNRLRTLSSVINPLPEYPKMRGITGEGGILKKSWLIEAVIYILHKIGVNKI